MELKHESITLSSLVRRAASPNLLNLNLFFPRRWRRPGSRLSPFPLPPRPGYLKVPIVHVWEIILLLRWALSIDVSTHCCQDCLRNYYFTFVLPARKLLISKNARHYFRRASKMNPMFTLCFRGLGGNLV